jgi:putative heme degradation protein
MTKDPERIKRRAAAAAKLGITEDELRQRRVADDALHLERKASEAGLPVDRYLAQRRKERNASKREGHSKD